MRITRIVARLCAIWAVLRTFAAYLDPGSGSLIVQLLIAALVGILATFRFWKARLLSLFGIEQESSDEDDDDEVEQ